MLTAVGIDSEIELDGEAYAVRVDAAVHAHALHHLWQYEQERQVVRPVEPASDLQPDAWRGAVVYALVLLLVPFAVAQGWVLDPYGIGVMEPARLLDGQLWRAWTALTLHWDASHLLGNLGAGMLLGFSAAQIWGNARAWALIIPAGALANLLEACLASGADYVSAGASTLVFAALGLVAAWSWRTRRRYAHNMLRRWVPLIAGIAVLAMFGAGDAQIQEGLSMQPFVQPSGQTNVLSHALGFITGALAGVLVATERGNRLLRNMPAWLAVSAATAPVVVAWTIAVIVSAH